MKYGTTAQRTKGRLAWERKLAVTWARRRTAAGVVDFAWRASYFWVDVYCY
jgi:hypothetical protein